MDRDLLELPLSELILRADKIRKELSGGRFEICSIINAKSGLCSQDCKFCAQSWKHPAGLSTYPLKSKQEIIEAAKQAKEIGAQRFGIVTSGKRLIPQEIDAITEVIGEIRNRVGIKVCASLGALNRQELSTLKSAGLTRYHHNIETSPRFYPQVVSTHNFKERVDTINAAKEVGLGVCSGGIIGMGETWEDRIDMACFLRELGVDSVPLNILVPIRGTPLESREPISCSGIIRTIAIFRILLKDKIVKIAAGRETILKDFQGLGFMAGANGMLIGGYLTLRGRDVGDDHRFIKEIRKIWTE